MTVIFYRSEIMVAKPQKWKLDAAPTPQSRSQRRLQYPKPIIPQLRKSVWVPFDQYSAMRPAYKSVGSFHGAVCHFIY